MGYMGLRKPAIFTQKAELSSLKTADNVTEESESTTDDTADTKPPPQTETEADQEPAKYQRSALDSETSRLSWTLDSTQNQPFIPHSSVTHSPPPNTENQQTTSNTLKYLDK
jgi:hypothetical protein